MSIIGDDPLVYNLLMRAVPAFGRGLDKNTFREKFTGSIDISGRPSAPKPHDVPALGGLPHTYGRWVVNFGALASTSLNANYGRLVNGADDLVPSYSHTRISRHAAIYISGGKVSRCKGPAIIYNYRNVSIEVHAPNGVPTYYAAVDWSIRIGTAVNLSDGQVYTEDMTFGGNTNIINVADARDITTSIGDLISMYNIYPVRIQTRTSREHVAILALIERLPRDARKIWDILDDLTKWVEC